MWFSSVLPKINGAQIISQWKLSDPLAVSLNWWWINDWGVFTLLEVVKGPRLNTLGTISEYTLDWLSDWYL